MRAADLGAASRGRLSAQQGKTSEGMALRILREFGPEWLGECRAATPEEDARGIDMVCGSDVGPLYLQVKSNAAGADEHRRKYPRSRAEVAIVAERASDDAARAVLLTALGRARERVLARRTNA